MTRVAVVGLGRWGRVLLSKLAERADIVVACSTGRAEGRNWLRSEYPSIPWTASYADVLSCDAVDAVVLATPIPSHATLARLALEHDKHVFVEKPLATDPEAAKELVELSRTRRLALFVGHTFLYDEAFRQLRRATMHDPVQSASFRWHKFGTFDTSIQWNLLPHDVALALALFGVPPTRLRVVTGSPQEQSCDHSLVELEFGARRSAVIEHNRRSNVRLKSIRATTASRTTYVCAGGRLWRAGSSGVARVDLSRDEPLASEISAFLSYVDAAVPREHGDLGRDVVRTLTMLDRP